MISGEFNSKGELVFEIALIAMAQEQAEQERQRANRLAERLRQMGINPDDV